MLTENGNTGIVRSGRDNNFYGNIGNNATDLSVPPLHQQFLVPLEAIPLQWELLQEHQEFIPQQWGS